MTRLSKRFSPEDLRAVEEAVERAESLSSGELVSYITGSSDPYHLAAWKGAALGSVLLALAAAVVFTFSSLWGSQIEAWLVMPALLGGALGYLAGRMVAPIRRALIDREVLEERVRRRASEVFLREEVFATRDRTGVLLFVSLFERRVVVLADSGIRERVPPTAWDAVVQDLVLAIHQGEAARGLAAAVEACGGILASYRLTRPDADADELPDHVRLEESE